MTTPRTTSAPLRLAGSVAASTFDPYYEAAFVYCRDADADYDLVLLRAPGADTLELRAGRDHALVVSDLDVRWDGRTLTVWVDEPQAARLDGWRMVEARLQVDDEAAAQVTAALARIFRGKRGLQLLA